MTSPIAGCCIVCGERFWRDDVTHFTNRSLLCRQCLESRGLDRRIAPAHATLTLDEAARREFTRRADALAQLAEGQRSQGERHDSRVRARDALN